MSNEAERARIESLIDKMVSAGRTLERYEDPRLRPLSDQNFRFYDSARRDIREVRAALAQPTAQAVDPQRQALKTCPFCDGAARFGKCVPGEQDMANDGAEYVECEACGASTCLVFPCMDDVKQSLRERWNRRAALASRRDSGAGGVGGSARVAQAH